MCIIMGNNSKKTKKKKSKTQSSQGEEKEEQKVPVLASSSSSSKITLPNPALSSPPRDHELLLAVIEFHHMLIGSSHKKEAVALTAAKGLVVGYIFMGCPSMAIIQATKSDLLEWLLQTKRAGKPGSITYWTTLMNAKNSHASIHTTTDDNNHAGNKLKVMPYAAAMHGGGKSDRMDTTYNNLQKNFSSTTNTVSITKRLSFLGVTLSKQQIIFFINIYK